MLLEWTDPPFAPGHWIPEMIDLAGGDPVLGVAGEKSVRVTFEDVRAAAPDVVIVAPCGYDREGAQALADEMSLGPCCPAAYPCTRSTPTPRGRGPAPAWSTGSRSSPRCLDVDQPRDRLHLTGRSPPAPASP